MGKKLVFLDDGFFDIKFTYFYFCGILGYKKRVVRYKPVPPDPDMHNAMCSAKVINIWINRYIFQDIEISSKSDNRRQAEILV